ncbi:MAG TPA: sulfotransferase [Caulobacteraceae bacterium]
MTASNRPGARAPKRPKATAAAFSPAEIAERLDAAGAHYAAGRLDEAARAYEAVEARNPGDIRAPYSLAVIDIRLGRLTPAFERLKGVVRREPGLFIAQHNLGFVCQTLGLWPQAAAAYAAALALRPDAVETGFNLAAALAILGRTDEAIRRYRGLMADPATALRALTGAALLKPSAITDDELATLRRAAADLAVAVEVRTGLLFALGEVLEARGSDEDAFAAFAAGNRLKYETLVAAASGPAGAAAHPNAIARDHARSATRVRALFTPAFIAARRGSGVTAQRPIFIVGFPRSGSTLIEQILSSHPAVQGMGESSALADVLERNDAYEPGRTSDFRELAQDYLANLRVRGWKPASRPVDKTLESFLHVGMIHLMFPRAIILHSVRDPVDTGLACYRQLFGQGNETLYDLGQIGAEYVGYRAVMDHWRAVLPGRVIDVSHEVLVSDPEGQIRWLVTEACGLAWDPACLAFHRTNRPVRTASVAQVRQPIFTTSLQRWRRYERHLGPLLQALGPYAP